MWSKVNIKLLFFIFNVWWRYFCVLFLGPRCLLRFTYQQNYWKLTESTTWMFQTGFQAHFSRTLRIKPYLSYMRWCAVRYFSSSLLFSLFILRVHCSKNALLSFQRILCNYKHRSCESWCLFLHTCILYRPQVVQLGCNVHSKCFRDCLL